MSGTDIDKETGPSSASQDCLSSECAPLGVLGMDVMRDAQSAIGELGALLFGEGNGVALSHEESGRWSGMLLGIHSELEAFLDAVEPYVREAQRQVLEQINQQGELR